ncbi:MAG TPA: iron-sulfur cluster insertion protein ErpA [Gammaproteobacteria bacterium]|nr:iron-sulfur cluster insertion protein ErpA [Gammaproteobacteria bacterium]
MSLSITEAAASKVWDLIKETGNHKLKLRVYVTGGGCSGMQYGFTFDENIQADDSVVDKNLAGSAENPPPLIQVLVDSISLSYLNGSEIDYKCDLESEEFIIRNPNAATTCGCGSSFTVEETQA